MTSISSNIANSLMENIRNQIVISIFEVGINTRLPTSIASNMHLVVSNHLWNNTKQVIQEEINESN